jgi:hypothetical protein
MASDAGTDHPPRHEPDERIPPVLEPLPAQRQLGRGRPAVIADLSVQVLLNFREALVPARHHLVLAGEAKGQAEVLELHEVDVPARIRRDPIQHLEKFLAAPRLAMQPHEQRVLRPLALRAPRRGQDRFVERGAQRIARRQDDLVGHSLAARVILEPADLLERVAPEPGNVHRRHRIAQLAGEHQQQAGRLHERVQPDAEERARGDLESDRTR